MLIPEWLDLWALLRPFLVAAIMLAAIASGHGDKHKDPAKPIILDAEWRPISQETEQEAPYVWKTKQETAQGPRTEKHENGRTDSGRCRAS